MQLLENAARAFDAHVGADAEKTAHKSVEELCLLAAAGIKTSMDGRGRWMDNVFIEPMALPEA